MPIYMKFEGIVGPVKGKHAGWIQLESCDFDRGRRAAGGVSGNSIASDISISKRQDSATTALFREATSGTGRNVTIDLANGDGVAFMTLKLENTFISSMNVGNPSANGAYDFMTLSYTKIEYETKPAGPADDANPRITQAVWNTTAP